LFFNVSVSLLPRGASQVNEKGLSMNITVIGNGVAGVTTAESIRAVDKECKITIITDEPHAFYSRPRLVELLADKTTAEQITIHARNWYEKNGIDLLNSVTIDRVDTEAKTLRDTAGGNYSYDKLVIASGATSYVPPLPGAGLPDVYTLRTIGDAEKIKQAVRLRKNAVVIGGGLLGIEAAYSLVSLGARVTVIEMFNRLLPRQLDSEGSELIRHLLEKKGLSFYTGRNTRSIEKAGGSLAVNLKDGESVGADLVLFSAGIRPAFQCVKDTAIVMNKGIIVDAFMRTSVPDVYACGDVAEFDGTLFGLWQPAREQAIACGNHLTGRDTPFTASVPSTRLKVAGIDFASIGDIETKEDVQSVVEKNENAGIYKKLFMRENKLIGALLIGNVKEAVKFQQLIKNNGTVV
jgi:nitrite reductase (NADH) large subunit